MLMGERMMMLDASLQNPKLLHATSVRKPQQSSAAEHVTMRGHKLSFAEIHLPFWLQLH